MARVRYIYHSSTNFSLDQDTKSYATKDGKLKIIGGDYFKLTPDLIGGKVDCVWDQGSIVAIDKGDREK